MGNNYVSSEIEGVGKNFLTLVLSLVYVRVKF